MAKNIESLCGHWIHHKVVDVANTFSRLHPRAVIRNKPRDCNLNLRSCPLPHTTALMLNKLFEGVRYALSACSTTAT
jgi:hypothetical protein